MSFQGAPRLPWWRSGYVWLVIGLMAAAVVASVATLYLALQVPAVPVGQQGGGGPAATQAQSDALEPALQARNRTSSRNARAMGQRREAAPAPSDGAVHNARP